MFYWHSNFNFSRTSFISIIIRIIYRIAISTSYSPRNILSTSCNTCLILIILVILNLDFELIIFLFGPLLSFVSSVNHPCNNSTKKQMSLNNFCYIQANCTLALQCLSLLHSQIIHHLFLKCKK